MRVTGKRRAVGMVGGQEYPPRVIDQQESFQADGPLQRIDEILILVFERHHAAARIAFYIHRHPFIGAGVFVIGVLAHAVARCRDGLTEQNLPDIDGDIFVAIDGFGNLRRTG